MMWRRLYLIYAGILAQKYTVKGNLALGKPAYQSTTTASIPWATAELAVDGNTGRNFHHGSCTHTDDSDNPWWAVDLQDLFYVHTVILTNRGDCCPERLSHVRVGMTNVAPTELAPTVQNVKICASIDGPLPPADTSIECGATGRFLVVMLEKSDILTLCEVQAFGDVACPEGPATKRPNLRPSQTTTVDRAFLASLTPEQQRTMWSCLKECLLNPCCLALSLNPCLQKARHTEELDFVKLP